MSNIKADVNVKIDADVNEMASRLLAGMGIDQAAAIDMFFRQIIKAQGLPFQPEPACSLDEQLTEAIRTRSAPAVRLECDGNGDLTIDKHKHPDIYDWLVNG